MANQQICTFVLNGIYFGIDVLQVQEVMRPQAITWVPLAPPDICGLINLRGQIVTVVDLQRRLELTTDAPQPNRFTPQAAEEPQGFNIVLQRADDVVAFRVDQVGDVLEFSQDAFEPPPATLKGRMRQMLAGAYSLPEGFLLIVDVEKVLAV